MPDEGSPQAGPSGVSAPPVPESDGSPAVNDGAGAVQNQPTNEPPTTEPEAADGDTTADTADASGAYQSILQEALQALAAPRPVDLPWRQNANNGAANAPGTQPPTPRASEAYVSPIASDALAKIRDEYPELGGVFEGLDKAFKDQHARGSQSQETITRLTQQFDQVQAFVQEVARERAQAKIDPIIAGLGFDTVYGGDTPTPMQRQARELLVQHAAGISQYMAQTRGVNLTESQAIALAHAAITGDQAAVPNPKAAAVKQVQQSVVQRSAQRRIDPSTRTGNPGVKKVDPVSHIAGLVRQLQSNTNR